MGKTGKEIIPFDELNIEATIARNPILNEFSSTFISMIVTELKKNPNTMRITLSVTSLEETGNPLTQNTRRVTFQKKVVDGINIISVVNTKMQNKATSERADIDMEDM